ncbi:nucleotide triphosphate diphosphatase NUDT15 [Larsenimonas suaedae]|uniref:NUDIX domain-containing protein n=1 Tax=Larsenimonas suaedae TaxID=1851019 RepID=A0ABU1GRK1_9GAMM|nr:NUDIX domain-containing protein [Larsenimonas suaedae]MCM2972556.1 NUDIX domain-containing protein [Larsenimonas suaedae]MDR5894648.1 NUDIX domain-containing protein [Larsenimonas suaedae]
MPSKPTSRVGVGVIVARDDGNILLGYREKADEPSCWCLPGGHVDPGEDFETAARRELHEETGIRADVSVQVFALFQDLTNPVTSITAGAELSLPARAAEPRVTEPHVFTCWRWFSLDALPEPLFPAAAAMFRHYTGTPQSRGWVEYPITS